MCRFFRHWDVVMRESQTKRKSALVLGFSLIEIIMVVAVIGLLAAISVPSHHAFKRRVEKAQCIGNLKVLHTGFDSYLLDQNQWPQMPEEMLDWGESRFFGWWIEALVPYGVGEESWLCPSDKVVKQTPGRTKEYASSYVPTRFNSHQFTPYRWNQPWLIERGDFHGRGGHVMMPDGSIASSQSPWGER